MSKTFSLTDIEVQFQSLRYRLALKLSDRLKTRFLGDFCIIMQNRNNKVLNHSYYQEMILPLINYLSSESLDCQPVDQQYAIYETIKYIDHDPEFETDNRKFVSCKQLVKTKLVTTLVHLFEFEESVRVACENQTNLVDLEQFSGLQSIGELCKEVKHQQLPQSLIDMYQDIQNRIEIEYAGFSHQKVWIPLIEKFEDPPTLGVTIGTLFPLDLDIEVRQSDHSRDIITFNNHPIGRNDLVNYQAQDAISAARKEHKFLNRSTSERYSVGFGFPSTDYSISGSSFGLGMSILVLCKLGREANLRRIYSISNAVAFTGGIDLNGKVRAVSSEGLKEKISTAFYSGINAFVFPEENLLDGRKFLMELQRKHPRKVFSLVPETVLPQILHREEILKYEKTPLSTWLKNHLSRSKIIQMVLSIILTVFITLGALSLFTDSNPSDFAVEGEAVLFFNNTGKHLWNIDLGHVPDYLEDMQKKKPIYRRLQIHDYDGDGENEVILGTAIKRHEFNGHLLYIETGGEVEWRYTDHPTLKFGGFEYTDNYGVHFIYPHKPKDSLKYEIYARFSHMPWFPNRLARFNLKGEVLDEFVHPGSINDLEFIDLDNDGEMEMLLGGTNNGYNDAGVAILPSRNFGGTTPLWQNGRTLEGWAIDSNLVYIKFPKWGKYDLTGTNSRSHVDDIFLDSHNGFIVTTVLGDKKKVGAYMYHFDLSLNLISLSVSDGFFANYYKTYGENFFDTFDREEWYEQMTKLDIWRGGEWN